MVSWVASWLFDCMVSGLVGWLINLLAFWHHKRQQEAAVASSVAATVMGSSRGSRGQQQQQGQQGAGAGAAAALVTIRSSNRNNRNTDIHLYSLLHIQEWRAHERPARFYIWYLEIVTNVAIPTALPASYISRFVGGGHRRSVVPIPNHQTACSGGTAVQLNKRRFLIKTFIRLEKCSKEVKERTLESEREREREEREREIKKEGEGERGGRWG